VTQSGSIALRRQRDVEAPRDAGQPVTSPAVAERDGDREHPRPLPRRHAIEVANQLCEKVVGVQFLDDQFQERARPRQLRRARSEQP
jgi:hypothetical protein